MKRETRAADVVSRLVVAVATGWFAFAAFWGLFRIPASGHLGAGSTAQSMAAEQIVRWHILYPAWDWYLDVEPPKSVYICHHPFLQYYVPAIFVWLFGHKDFIVGLPAALMSTAIPLLLYGIGKARWGAAVGAVAAASYVVVPIAIGFSDFTNLETFCIFGALVFFWGHARFLQTWATRDLVVSLVGIGFTCLGDWVGYMLVTPALVWSLVRAFVLPARATPPIRLESYVRWWALSVAVAGATIVYTLGLFFHANAISQWVMSAMTRGVADPTPLDEVLTLRKNWIDFSFTPLCIWIGKAAAPICLARLLILRRDEEAYALSTLVGAVFQYLAFKEGADIHIFWPHYFALYFALAMAQLAATAGWMVGTAARLFLPARAPAVAAFAALVAGLLPVLAMAPDGVRSLPIWRRTGGRYDDNGKLIRSHVDQLFVMQEVILPQKTPGMTIDLYPSLGWGWEDQWKFAGNPNKLTAVPQAGSKDVATHPFWMARGSLLPSDDQKKIAAAAHLRIYEDTWIVDQREPAAPLDAFRVSEREPTRFEWLVYGGTEPRRSIGRSPDPWLTWEWRTHLDQDADPPTGTPQSLDEIRIAYNVAIAKNNQDDADRWKETILGQLDRTPATAFTTSVRLLGVRLLKGVQPRLESWFECTAPFVTDDSFGVRSTVEEQEPYSLIPPDTMDREMGYPPNIPTKLWRPGFIYKTTIVLNHRIGRERYDGYWTGGNGVPRRTDDQKYTRLVVLP
ncbi:MAG TPA: glycosyltransferase family 39 protein [Polyangiaceae bacterium]